MRILFLGLNYSPERIGVAVYSTGLCEELAARGHELHAVVGKPYYPEWRVHEAFRGGGHHISEEGGVRLTRVPLYVPRSPMGGRRIVHHLSFALSALGPMLREAWIVKPHIVVTVAPSLIAAPIASFAALLVGAKTWLHIQDFEVGASFATGLVSSTSIAARLARRFERFVLRRFDRVSSISPEMCNKAKSIITSGCDVFEFRNWAKLDEISPIDRPSVYRDRWNITARHVALYSGNIANKQGLEIVVDAARLLAKRRDLIFVICGDGPNREALERRAEGLRNIQFRNLQPTEQLNELLGLATIHLLPQKAEAADLVLPSKLTNILASGRPLVATANPETGLAREVAGVGLLATPGQPPTLAAAISRLVDEPELYAKLSAAARARAESTWSHDKIISAAEQRMLDAVSKSRKGARSTLLTRK